MSKYLILFLLSFLTINCIVENPIELELTLYGVINREIGKKGTAVTHFFGGEQFHSTKRETCFTSKLSNGNQNFTVDCGLWRAEINYFFSVFCDIKENFPAGNYRLFLDELQPFYCGNYHVTFDMSYSGGDLTFKKVDKDIIDLYSETENLTIENEVDSYELKFNIVSYHQEQLVFNKNLLLNNCKTENNILKCIIKKEEIAGYHPPSQNISQIYYIEKENCSTANLFMVPQIKIIKKDIQKKDIYVGIKKLLVNIDEYGVPIAYETNVTDIPNIYISDDDDDFYLTFINKNSEGIEDEYDSKCKFRKYDANPLIIICSINYPGTNWLKEIKEEKLIDNNNILYNFRIQPVKNEDKIDYDGTSSKIKEYYPKILDFTKKDGPLYVYFRLQTVEGLNGLTYNEDAEDLTCEQIAKNRKKCEVTIKHFKGKKNGFYFIKHTNHKGTKTISYEVPPLKVILDSSKGNIISFSLIYSFLLLLIMI